jgi:hypothetical protein
MKVNQVSSKAIYVALMAAAFFLWGHTAFARGYPGGRHYGHMGGQYAGGIGSSHRGGHYVNPRTGNRYTHHY